MGQGVKGLNGVKCEVRNVQWFCFLKDSPSFHCKWLLQCFMLTCQSSFISGFDCVHTDVLKIQHFLLTASGIPQSAILQAWRRMSSWWSQRTPNQQLPPNSASRRPRTKKMWRCLTQLYYNSHISICTSYHLVLCKIWLNKFCHLVAKLLNAALSSACSNIITAIYAAFTCELL